MPLVGIALDRTGKPVNGALVTWQAPADQAVLSDTVSVSGAGSYPDPANPGTIIQSDGIVSTRVRLVSDQRVSVSVRGAQFSVGGGPPPPPPPPPPVPSAPPVLRGLSRLDGDAQWAPRGYEFPRPLLVQLSGDRTGGTPVSFTASGDLKLTPALVLADVWGRAEAIAVAGASPGVYTVTAKAGSFVTTFNLTVGAETPSTRN
ncbi:MAG: hypothetical protein K2X03_04460 [Bryobacteraceae bacterium]|nr:hypothetical protein [Bryobacteraceae bacterium]